MSEIQKQELASMNIAEEQLRKLKELFPEAFTEGLKVDWDKLRLTLGQSIDVGKERYGMNWPGKADCFKTIQQPSIATLIPARDESVDFDTTGNLFIEGDNLEVLKLLQKSYLGKIKMIYIDPPYNTGNEFIYPDNYSESLETYLEYTGQIDSGGKKFATNTDADGRFHSKWLNMMFPRLFLAKNLLRQDGAIFISIDDSEYDNLKKICNEIFGEENYITTIVRRRRKSQANLSQNISAIHEYILCFSKSDQFQVNRLSDSIDADSYTNPDNDPRGPYVTMPCTNKGGSKYEIETPSGIKHLDEWRFKKETYDELFAANKIVFSKGGDGKPRYKLFLSEKLEKGVLPNTWWDNMASNQEATIELKELFDGKVVFENPKPVDLIKQIIKLGSSKGDIVLDFFAGSGATGHAALDLSYSGEERNFILVQLPFDVDDNSEARKMGFERISVLSAERLKRVINKFEKDQSLFKSDKSFGFKYFTLSNSNFKIWDSALEKKPEVIQTKLFEHIDHISPEAGQEAILFELLLKSGFQLTTPIEKLTLADKIVFSIAEGSLLICLEKELTHDCIKAMAEMQPTRVMVICLDEGFKGENADALKTNAVQIMKGKGVVNFRTV